MRWPWQKHTTTQQRCLGIELHNGQAFAVLRDVHGVTERFLPQAEHQGLEPLALWLKQLRRQQPGLQQLPVTISLDHNDYELHLLEAPRVPDDELSDALRFRVKDMVSQPIETLVVQAFRLPQDAYRGRLDMAFAAVIERVRIRQLVDWCEQQQLLLQHITIPELSILQLVAELEPETSVGVLRLDQSAGDFYLFLDGGLYMTRSIGVGSDDLGLQPPTDGEFELESHSRLETLALEIQRSMDYFESQLGMGSVGQIWVMVPDGAELDVLLPDLEQAVNTPIRTLALDSLFNRMAAPATLTASLATALGGSLCYELAG
ncbi:hypothetical protein [Bacterioplanoides pacificum]|uniref:MSHA biogenesis protein MshI n=1 Tax=Bacterioplanoides pacificum TaxID=1171596 RepID=A0ABV7VMC8_9GAMM